MTTINLTSLKAAVILVITLLTTSMNAQSDAISSSSRTGFVFEFSIGTGIIALEDNAGIQTFDDPQGAISFPELKFGYMLNNKLALTASTVGMIYEFQENDRHFGGLIPSVQYWVSDNWWIHGGAGLAIDSPALYDVTDENENVNFGFAAMASVGYEVFKRKNFAVNIQTKLMLGRSYDKDTDFHRDATMFNLGIGFSWL